MKALTIHRTVVIYRKIQVKLTELNDDILNELINGKNLSKDILIMFSQVYILL